MISTDLFKNRRQVFARVHLVSGLTLGLFIIFHWLEDCCYSLSVFEGILAIVMLFTYWQTRQGAKLSHLENVLMATSLALFSALIWLDSLEQTGAFWVAGFPFIAYFVKQVDQARYWVLFLLVELLIAALLEVNGLMVTPYSATQLFCLMGAILFFWLFAHIYQSQLESRTALLETAYRQLEQQQQHMQVILDHSPIAIWRLDNKQRIQFLNKACMDICGVAETKADNIEDYTDLLPDHLIHILTGKQLAPDEADDGRAYYGHDEIICADGNRTLFDVIKVGLIDEHGQASGLIGFAIDVTGKLAAEAEQKSLEDQLQHAHRLESLGVMAGGIAHDFNNLLTVIIGSLELARMDNDLSESLQESLSCMDAAAQAATDLCRQMLAYSGKGLMRLEAIHIPALIENMHALLDASKGNHVALAFHCEADIAAVSADRGQMSQVLLNLIINASEAIAPEQQGAINVHVSRRHLDLATHDRFYGTDLPAGGYTVVIVEDNGIGMNNEVIEHIFDPFFTTKFTGRGLGMSAILGILSAHKAGMQVHSKPGVGTSISVWLPCLEEVLDIPESNPVIDGRPSSGRVLLVDDEDSVRRVSCRMLEHLGLSVVVAENGREAVEIFSNDQHFDWVLLDVMMPEMGGVECLQQLRALDPDIYIVLTSGYDADSLIAGGNDKRSDDGQEDDFRSNDSQPNNSQPNDFLSKPYIMTELRDILNKVRQHADHKP